MNTILARAALAAAILGCGAAIAHPRLTFANPAANSNQSVPKEVRLGFSETLIRKFSSIRLTDSGGRARTLGAVALSPDRKQMVASIGARLTPGAYRVQWRAVSNDTHRVQGAYAFTVVR